MSGPRSSLIRSMTEWAFLLGFFGVFVGPALLLVGCLSSGTQRGDPLVALGPLAVLVFGSIAGVATGIVVGPVVAFILSRRKGRESE